MKILDTSFEENSFIIDGYTLEYKNENDTPEWKYAIHNKTGNPLYPYYVGVKNKTGVHVPINAVKGISPFDMSNPKLSDLFGLHVYNKPFGFQDMQIIPSVNNYPYYGDDENKRGLYYSYDGLVTGYVLNGVGEEDIKLTNGNKELKVYTINEDDITNSETKRVIYTPKDSNDVLPYGTYYKVETYFYGVNGRTEYSPSGKSTFYYKNIENDEVTYVQISPQDVKLGEYINEYYTIVNNTYNIISSSVDGDNGKIQIYDENGMVYYIKQEDGQGNESYVRNDNISDYQYAVISNENNTLHLTDGYGEDVEINLNEGYDRLYPTDIILDIDNNKLKINKSQIDYYDDFKLFKKALPIEVYVTEDVYNLYDSDNKVEDLINEITVTSNEVNYKINIVVHKSTFNIDTNNNFIEYKYKLDNHTYNIINREIENNCNLNISCNDDLSYSKPSDESDAENDILNNFLDIIIGEDIKDKNKDYKITKVEEGIEVSIVIDDTGNRNNVILDENLTMGNFNSTLETKLPPIYVYNRNSQSIYIKTTISQYKEIQEIINGDNINVYITLDIGEVVYIGELVENKDYYTIELLPKQQVEFNGLIYTYSISTISENKYIYNPGMIKYFPESPNDLLSIFDDNIQGDNLLSYKSDDTKEYYVYDLKNENIDYVFMLCKKIYNGIIYYTYSPKICCKPIQLSIDVTENSTDLEIKQDGDIINRKGFYYIKLTNEGNLSQNANTTFMCNIPVKFRKPKEVDVIYNPTASFNVKLSLLNVEGDEEKEINSKQYSYIFLPDLKFNNSDKYVYTISSDDVRILKSHGADEVIINRYSIEDVNKLNSEEVEFGIINSQISIISSEKPINQLRVEITQSVYKNTINSSGLLIKFNNDIDNSIEIEDDSFFYDLINVKYNQTLDKVNINVSNNQYLSNYNFIYEKLVKNENNEYIVSDTQNISPEMLNNNNITINYDYEKEKLNIYDCTGLKIINSKIE